MCADKFYILPNNIDPLAPQCREGIFLFAADAVKLKQRSQRLKEYCDANGLTYQNERTSVIGFGRSEAGKVTGAYNRWLREEEEKLQQKDLDNEKNRVILEIKIARGELPLIISPKQVNHMEKNHIAGKSYLTIDMDEIQHIVETMHGTGIVQITNHGTQFREVIELDHVAGLNVNNLTGVETPTNKIKIHYSKKGVHLVPTLYNDGA